MNPVRRPVSFPEYVFALFSLLLMIGALAPFYTSYSHLYSGLSLNYDPTSGNLEYQLLSVAVYVISLSLLYHHRATVIDLLIRNKGLIIFVGFVLLSSLWAQDSLVSLRRSIALAGTTVFAIYISARFQPHDFIRLLAIAMFIVMFETIFVRVFFPIIGAHSGLHDGAWRGVFGHKNIAGRILVFATLTIWIFSGLESSARPFIRMAVALGLGLIALTQSGTSLVVILSLILGLAVFRVLRRSSINLGLRIALILMFIVLPMAFMLFSSFEEALALLGRDETLTGRTTIWEDAVKVGITRPWLGFGYRTFWIEEGATAYLGWGHGHNSFLDVWLELGFVGLALFAVVYITAIRRALWRLTQSQDVLGVWHPLFLFAFTLFALTGKVFPEQGTIEWVLFVSVLLHLAPRGRSLPAFQTVRSVTT